MSSSTGSLLEVQAPVSLFVETVFCFLSPVETQPRKPAIFMRKGPDVHHLAISVNNSGLGH